MSAPNIIVEVDPGEVAVLVQLVENLFDDWYVARFKREERFKKLKDIAKQKNDAKKIIEIPPTQIQESSEVH